MATQESRTALQVEAIEADIGSLRHLFGCLQSLGLNAYNGIMTAIEVVGTRSQGREGKGGAIVAATPSPIAILAVVLAVVAIANKAMTTCRRTCATIDDGAAGSQLIVYEFFPLRIAKVAVIDVVRTTR